MAATALHATLVRLRSRLSIENEFCVSEPVDELNMSKSDIMQTAFTYFSDTVGKNALFIPNVYVDDDERLHLRIRLTKICSLHFPESPHNVEAENADKAIFELYQLDWTAKRTAAIESLNHVLMRGLDAYQNSIITAAIPLDSNTQTYLSLLEITAEIQKFTRQQDVRNIRVSLENNDGCMYVNVTIT
jgi:hypothetical protein